MSAAGVSGICRCSLLPLVSWMDHELLGCVDRHLWHMQVFFAATGVSDGDLLRGVRYFSGGASTNSIVMRASSGTGECSLPTPTISKHRPLPLAWPMPLLTCMLIHSRLVNVCTGVYLQCVLITPRLAQGKDLYDYELEDSLGLHLRVQCGSLRRHISGPSPQ